MNTQDVIQLASHYLNDLSGHTVDVLDVSKPVTANAAVNLANGYKFQGSTTEFLEAQKIVESWGTEGKNYQPTREYQILLRELLTRYKYRLDTNFAKMDRIRHPGIEEFKKRVYNTEVSGMTVVQWNKLLASNKEEKIKEILRDYFDIRTENIDRLLG